MEAQRNQVICPLSPHPSMMDAKLNLGNLISLLLFPATLLTLIGYFYISLMFPKKKDREYHLTLPYKLSWGTHTYTQKIHMHTYTYAHISGSICMCAWEILKSSIPVDMNCISLLCSGWHHNNNCIIVIMLAYSGPNACSLVAFFLPETRKLSAWSCSNTEHL